MAKWKKFEEVPLIRIVKEGLRIEAIIHMIQVAWNSKLCKAHSINDHLKRSYAHSMSSLIAIRQRRVRACQRSCIFMGDYDIIRNPPVTNESSLLWANEARQDGLNSLYHYLSIDFI